MTTEYNKQSPNPLISAFREQTSLTCGWSRSVSTRRSAQNMAWSSSWPPERVRQPDAFCRPERSLGVCAVYFLLNVILRRTRLQVKVPHSEATTPMTACARLCCSVKKWRLLACHTLIYPPPPLSAVIERDSCLEGGSAVYTRCLRHTQLCLSPPSLMWLVSLCHILLTTAFYFHISVLKRAHFIFMTSFCAPSLKRHNNSCRGLQFPFLQRKLWFFSLFISQVRLGTKGPQVSSLAETKCSYLHHLVSLS